MWSPVEGSPSSTSPASAAVQHAVALDDADDATREVVVARAVDAGHLGRLAADERAAVRLARRHEPADDLLGDVGREAAGAEVVEEEERARATDCDVIDAVVDEVLAHRVVTSDADGHLQLRPDPVDGGDEHRGAVGGSVEGEEPAEGANVGEHA